VLSGVKALNASAFYLYNYGVVQTNPC